MVSLPTAIFIILLWVVFITGASFGVWFWDKLNNSDGED